MSRGGRTTKIHSIVADETLPIVRRLSPGSTSDDPEGQKLMEQVPPEIGKDKPLTIQWGFRGALVLLYPFGKGADSLAQ